VWISSIAPSRTADNPATIVKIDSPGRRNRTSFSLRDLEMRSSAQRFTPVILGAGFIISLFLGCQAARLDRRECPSPAELGMNTRDMVDKTQQDELDALINVGDFAVRADVLRKAAFETAMKERNPNAPPYREKNVLSLSGGGSFGAFSAGVVCGWTARGDRPVFDVVTGISTGALIAPFAFLGSAYDEQLKTFYTTLTDKDLYKTKLIRGLFRESLADNSPLAGKLDEVLTQQFIAEIATEHQAGRRLYIGTTAAESKQFVVWDIGAIACRGRCQDRDLIKQILLGSSAIPGVFPPQHITVEVDGKCVTERHIDGGVSQGLFIFPPYVQPEYRSKNQNTDLAGTNLYLVIAGKLYADLEKIKPMALNLVGKEISAMIYAQTRGDLQRMYTTSMLTGMNYYLTSIPPEYPAPTSGMAFKIPTLTGMFNEGYRIVTEGIAWRRTPPGVGPGENMNLRAGTCLTYEVRGPISRSEKGPAPHVPYPSSNEGIPAVPIIK
jgi:predicted patatin/cPLA2 family phospholipase